MSAPLPATPPPLSAAALGFWRASRDALLRGLVHALSNRVGTLVAVAGMLDADAPAAGPAVPILHGEVDRLERLLGELRRLAGDGAADAAPEPIHLPELVATAVAVHAHHPAQRERPVAVALDASLPPARARADDVAEALLLALVAAGSAGDVRVTGEVVGTRVALRVAPRGAAPGTAGGPGAGGAGVWAAECGAWLLAASGGSARAAEGGVVVELPGLGAG